MDVSTPVTQQRQKESRLLQIFVTSSLITSVAVHGIIMGFPVPTFRGDRVNPETDPEEIEILIAEVDTEAPQAEAMEDISPELDLTEPEPPESEAIAALEEPELEEPELEEPELEEPVQAVALAPALLPQPDSEVSAAIATDDPTEANLGMGAETQDNAIDQGEGNLGVGNPTTGLITPAAGTGTGLGLEDSNSSQSGNKLRSNGPSGTSQEQFSGTLNPRTTQPTPPASRSPRPPSTNPLRCLKCPQPEYQGTEASPRVELRIRPDGSVDVQLRESSGNAELDRRTLEVMSQWQFDPETVPEGGVRQRVRVTYEAQGSRFQRENQRRRQAEAQQRQAQQQTAAQEAAAQQQQDSDRRNQETPPAVTQDPPKAPSETPPTTPAPPAAAPSVSQETPEVPLEQPPSGLSATSEESVINHGDPPIPPAEPQPIEEYSPKPDPMDTPVTPPPASEPIEATEIPMSDPAATPSP